MKKVLIVITTGFAPYGGLTSVMLNYFRNMNRDGLQIDFASTNDPDTELVLELKEAGAEYYNLGDRKSGLVTYLSNLKRILRKNKYDVIHVNGNSATMVFELLVACFCGVKTRIAHGHTTQSDYPSLHKILYPVFKMTYTDAISTSRKGGDWLFKSNYVVLNNAIDVEHYQYSEIKREEVRRLLKLNNKFVIGNVGKLNRTKNHAFLIDVFEALQKKRTDAVLVIAGGGPLENDLKKKCEEKGIKDKVLFLGMLNDVSDILQAIDIFVFTSVFEGLGMALIEAQAAGLECVSSDVVPKETKVTEHIKYISLNEEPQKWAEEILKNCEYDRCKYSQEAAISIRDNGYDIKREVENLERMYKK